MDTTPAVDSADQQAEAMKVDTNANVANVANAFQSIINSINNP
jgi:hypothetical protein